VFKEKPMNPNSQPPNPFATSTNVSTVGQLASEEQMNFIRKTYVLFLAGVLCCIAVGAVTLMTPLVGVSLSILRMPILYIVLLVGGSIGAQVLAQRPGLDVVALFGFTGLLGFIMSPIIAMFAPSVVGQAGMLSAVIFGSLTAYAFISRKDFSFMGGMLFVGMISIIAGSIINALFFKNWGFSYFVSWGILLLSSGWVLYDTSNMIHSYRREQAGAAALGLFISFWNIFMSLLNILGGNRR
jgi:FtsH-binding integral membrane protein